MTWRRTALYTYRCIGKTIPMQGADQCRFGIALSMNQRLTIWQSLCRHYTTVLGIETSCDDTGVAIVNNCGRVLGETLQSQSVVHKSLGWGIHPMTAAKLHEEHIHKVVQTTLHKSNMTIEQVDAVATTVGPGLPFSLNVGLNYTKKLLEKRSTMFIAVHHMAAHALTARMTETVEFPYLVLLASGGHCILAVVKSACEFYRLGYSLDDAPGEAFDKVARMLELHKHPDIGDVAGGAAIEIIAKKGNQDAFKMPLIMSSKRNCHFSFAGLKTAVESHLQRIDFTAYKTWDQRKLQLVADMASSFQYYLTWHIAKRVRRAIAFCRSFSPQCQTLVLSGGVASNEHIRNELKKITTAFGYRLVCPSARLCTDNGIMIAWAGIEHLKSTSAIVTDPQSISYQPKWPLGEDVSEMVVKSNIKV